MSIKYVPFAAVPLRCSVGHHEVVQAREPLSGKCIHHVQTAPADFASCPICPRSKLLLSSPSAQMQVALGLHLNKHSKEYQEHYWSNI